MPASPAEIELLLEALANRDEVSWERTWAVWAPRVAVWVRRHPQFQRTGEDAQLFVSRALEKLWRAVDHQKLARFETPVQVLQYLKMCVNSSIVESLRRAIPVDLVYLDEEEQGGLLPDTGTQVEASVVGTMERNELWRIVAEHARTEQEQVLVEAALVRGLPPRAIAQRYSGLFGDVQDVYRLKRNLLERLGRDGRMRAFL
ncbi:MAG TPA: hypothetical protein VK191_08035 [Symbiobacteriaceae bacterium]|nr:hypothetical protein [Symbiobacteriaceae bacterium]